jgi:tRNA(Ser,Leu) C12 N-acetylase TAN1
MEWNVIVSVQELGYKTGRMLLQEYGKIHSTDYFNVLAMQVDDIDEFLEQMHALYMMKVPALKVIGRISPVTQRFSYQTPDEFEVKARAVVSEWLEELAGRRFYVRMHRRGFKGRLSSYEEERFLDGYILEQLASRGMAAAQVDFETAERVIAVETLGQQAGMSLWTAEQLQRYPFLKLD